MGDIQVGVILSFLGAMLPDVRTKDSSCSSKDDVSSSMERS